MIFKSYLSTDSNPAQQQKRNLVEKADQEYLASPSAYTYNHGFLLGRTSALDDAYKLLGTMPPQPVQILHEALVKAVEKIAQLEAEVVAFRKRVALLELRGQLRPIKKVERNTLAGLYKDQFDCLRDGLGYNHLRDNIGRDRDAGLAIVRGTFRRRSAQRLADLHRLGKPTRLPGGPQMPMYYYDHAWHTARPENNAACFSISFNMNRPIDKERPWISSHSNGISCSETTYQAACRRIQMWAGLDIWA